MKATRREFMVGCSAAIAALAGGRIGDLVFAQNSEEANRDVLVVLFMRGGCDALSLVAPTNDTDYNALRPSLRLSDTGEDAVLPLNNPASPSAGFGLHPSAAPIKELYDGGHLAIIHACGLTNGTRSHFDAMDFIEFGTPDNKFTNKGWLTRHLEVVMPNGIVPAVAASNDIPASLAGSIYASSMRGPRDFGLRGDSTYGNTRDAAIQRLYSNGSSPLPQAGSALMQNIDYIRSQLPVDSGGNIAPYEPEDDAEYTGSSLSDAFKTVAELVKLDIGLQVATINYGGWDTHNAQEFVFPNRVNELARSLQAFYNDMANYHNRLTVIVQTEFGRRLRENNNGGTDHGHGGLMMALGGNVNGGQMLGAWPGLANEQLDRGVDLAITTDYRQVLSEALMRRLNNANLGTVFPGLSAYTPLNIFQGSDQTAILD